MLFLPEPRQILCSRYADTNFCCGLNVQVTTIVLRGLETTLDESSSFLHTSHLCHILGYNLIDLFIFYVQGLVEDSKKSVKPSDILLNQLPVAVLDLSRKGTIKFSGYLHEHYRWKQRQCRQQELNILQQKQYDIPFTTE